MPSSIPPMGGLSLSLQMESISSILLSRGGTRRLDLGIVSPGATIPIRMPCRKAAENQVLSELGEKKAGAPKGVGAFGIEGVHGVCCLVPAEEAL